MNNNYNSDRQWSDEIYHGSTKKPILDLVTKSRLFGKVEDYVPSSEEDDNINCIDTYINNTPCQLRIQRDSGKKRTKYGPTLRYSRMMGSKTEVLKFINNYNKKKKGIIGIKIPKYLIWGMYNDELQKITQLDIVDIDELLNDRHKKYEKDNIYRMTKDTELYEHIDNGDGTTFLVIKGFSVFKYSSQ
jgi:hypothetical protein